MKKTDEVAVEVEHYTENQMPDALSVAMSDVKSYSPGEVFEFLQSKFPLYELKSKAHVKAASSVVETLSDLVREGSLSKSEASQVRLYVNTLNYWIEKFKEEEAEEAVIVQAAVAKKPGIADGILKTLKESVEAEKARLFSRVKSEPDTSVIEVNYKKVKSGRS